MHTPSHYYATYTQPNLACTGTNKEQSYVEQVIFFPVKPLLILLLLLQLLLLQVTLDQTSPEKTSISGLILELTFLAVHIQLIIGAI